MTVQNAPVKEMLDKTVPVKSLDSMTKPKPNKLKKYTKKMLIELMQVAFLEGGCSFNRYVGKFIYTVDRETIQKYKLDDLEPGMKFAVPLKQVRFGKKVRRVV